MQTLTQDQETKVKGLIQEFSKDPDIVSFVERTEARIATTKGHYGDYMAFLTPYQDKASALYIISEALKAAGADHAGVSWAIKLLKGY